MSRITQMAGKPLCTLFSLVLLSMPSAAIADDYPPKKILEFVAGVGLTVGGDKIADVDVETYDGDTRSAEVHAGNLFHLYGGVNVLIPDSDFSVQTTIGWHSDGIFTTDDGSIEFTRYPLELIPFYSFNKFRVGFGLTYHLSPKLNGNSDAGLGDREYEDALGTALAIEYRISSIFSLGLRYTNIEYELDKHDAHWSEIEIKKSEEIDGSNIGIYSTFLF